MARRATAIKGITASAEGAVLILDAGSSLSGQYVSRMAQGENMVEAMNAMGYDAMGIGYNDTTIGLDALQTREKQADFAMVSGNLVAAETQELYFDPYVIIERDGIKFGILGLSDTSATSQGAGFIDKATVLDATETARKYVAELEPQVDAIIVLSLLGQDADEQLAADVPGINVIVGGTSGELMQEPTRVGNTLIVQQGYNGEWMGVLQATFDAEGVPSNYTESLITLGPDYADDPEMAKLVEKWSLLYPTPTPTPAE